MPALLLDTHAVVWYLSDDERLSPTASRLLPWPSESRSSPVMARLHFQAFKQSGNRATLKTATTPSFSRVCTRLRPPLLDTAGPCGLSAHDPVGANRFQNTGFPFSGRPTWKSALHRATS